MEFYLTFSREADLSKFTQQISGKIALKHLLALSACVFQCTHSNEYSFQNRSEERSMKHGTVDKNVDS